MFGCWLLAFSGEILIRAIDLDIDLNLELTH